MTLKMKTVKFTSQFGKPVKNGMGHIQKCPSGAPNSQSTFAQ